MNEHTSKNFDLELENLRTRVLEMGPWWEATTPTPADKPTPAPPSRRSGLVCWGCNRDRNGHDALAAMGDDHPWLSHAEWRERGRDA